MKARGFTVKEAAQVLSVVEGTVRFWIFHRKIESIKLKNGRVLIPQEEINRLKIEKYESGRRPRRISEEELQMMKENEEGIFG